MLKGLKPAFSSEKISFSTISPLICRISIKLHDTKSIDLNKTNKSLTLKNYLRQRGNDLGAKNQKLQNLDSRGVGHPPARWIKNIKFMS